MTIGLFLGIVALTYGSRAASLVVLGAPRGRVEAVLARMPAPIFAGLAVLSLVGEGGRLASPPVLLAAFGAAVVGARRSLAVCLVGGVVGYGAGLLLA